MPDPLKRPPLTAKLSAEEFRAWYWLKEELVAFCRVRGISSAGLKQEIAGRIEAHLAAPGEVKTARRSRRAKRDGTMPARFTLETIIGQSWRCGPALGAFFKRELGSGFHFNSATRNFIHNGDGHTLGEAALCYVQSVRPGAPKAEIPPQLEYNRHFRKYFREHPGARREDALAAWWALRSLRKGE